MTGRRVFDFELLNVVLNQFVQRLEQMTFEEVLAFFELFIANQRKTNEQQVEDQEVDEE